MGKPSQPAYYGKVHFPSTKRKGKPLCNVGYTIYSPPILSKAEQMVDCKLCWIQYRSSKERRLQG